MSFKDQKAKIWGSRRRRYCYYCGIKLTFDAATVDHLISRRNGGSGHLKNLVIACLNCNTEKGSNNFIRKEL